MYIVLDYLEVILSPQMVIGGIALALCLIFKDDLKALIRRIGGMKLPGGFEISTSQEERIDTKEEPSTEEKTPVKLDETIDIPGTISLGPEEMQTIKSMLDSERARAAHWEYEFLNYYLVPNTQKVLKWLTDLQQPPTLALYDSIFSLSIPVASERRAILSALENHYLIVLRPGDLIEVTPKGHEYLSVRKLGYKLPT